MSHSVYLKLATLLVKADLRREERDWKRRIRRSAFPYPMGKTNVYFVILV